MEVRYTDKAAVLQAVKRAGYDLRFASEELRGDKEVVLEAVGESGDALEYASDNLRADKEVVLEAVRGSGSALEYANENLRADKDVVLEAVRKLGFVLRYASAELQADKEVVLEAVKENGKALQYASAVLRGDKEVVRCAVLRVRTALSYATRTLQADKDLVLLAARHVDPYSDLPIRIEYWMQEAGIDETTFRSAVNCPIAAEGQDCPIATVSLSSVPAECDIDGNVRVPESIRCSCNLMSGFHIECAPQRYGATLDDLARAIVDNLPGYMQSSNKRVFVNFAMGAESEPMRATPWDWDRPLVDFLPRLEQGPPA